MRHRNPLDERWSLNTVRWLETGPYAHVPAVRRLTDELRGFEGPRTATEYRLLKGRIERVFKALENRGQLDPEDEAADITRALLEGSLGLAESGVARPMPGTRQGPLRDIEERHPQAGRRQREREAGAMTFTREIAFRDRAIAAIGPGHVPIFGPDEGGHGLRVSCDNRGCAATGYVGEAGLGGNIFEPNRPCPEDPLIKEWNFGYDLDGGGYSFERVRGTPLGNAIELLLHEGTMLLDDARRTVDKMIMWDSPDLDYIIGSDDLPRHRADLLLIAPGRGGLSWPNKIPEPDAEGNLGNLMFEKRADGELYETSHDCIACEGSGVSLGHGGGGVRGGNCPRCDGNGHINRPGGAWAIYERVEITEEEEEEEEEEETDRPHDAGYDAASRDLEQRALSFVEEELQRLRRQERPLGRSATAGGWLDPAFVRGYADRLERVYERRADIDEEEEEEEAP